MHNLKTKKNNSYRGDISIKVFKADDKNQNTVCNLYKRAGVYENDRFSMEPLTTIEATLNKLATFEGL